MAQLRTQRGSRRSLLECLECIGRVTFFLDVVACRTQESSSGVGQDVAARPTTEGGRPVKVAHLHPDVFDVARRKWDVVWEAVCESEPLPVQCDYESIGAKDSGASWFAGSWGFGVAIPVKSVGAREMAAASDERETGNTWDRENIVLDLDKVLSACRDIGVRRVAVQATLIPVAVELGDEDFAVEHLGPCQACRIEVWMRNGDRVDFAGRASCTNTLHEFDRGKAATVPDDGTSLGEQHDRRLADSERRVELDSQNASI